ncbi:MAG: putative DNA-binding domain-containing protein [Proteobacteria bacterium]|nr:putative DNA-binding domain-containing protein [Pseudomonadota bacterium]
MSVLAPLQDAFQRRILDGGVDMAILDGVVGNAIADAGERVGVYVYAYAARLVEALGNDYLTLRFAAGDETFEQLCRDYVMATPSIHRNVRWYGRGLAEFLRATAPWKHTPALAELAALDWAIGLSFDALDEEGIAEADIAAIPFERWGEMILRLPRHVQRERFAWNVGEVRHARDHAQPCPPLQRVQFPQTWIFSRKDLEVHYRALESDEAAALDAIAGGRPFEAMCAALCDWHAQEDVALRAAGLLKAWIGNGWIAAVASPD